MANQKISELTAITGAGLAVDDLFVVVDTSAVATKSITKAELAGLFQTAAGGSDTQVQFNDGGSFGGDAGLAWNKTANALTLTSTAAAAIAVGPNGATNSVLTVDASTASQADGVKVTGLAAGGGCTLTVTSSGSNAPLTLTPKGTGSVVLPAGSSIRSDGMYQGPSANTVFYLGPPNADGSNGHFYFKRNDGTIYVDIDYISVRAAHFTDLNNTAFSVEADNNYFGMASGFQLVWSSTTSHWQTKDTGLARAAAGVVTITDSASGAGILEFRQVASGGTVTTNSARIYAKDVAGTAEVFVKDEAGNETQISPHAMDGPTALYDAADDSPYVVKELNYYLGKVRYLNLSRFATMFQRLVNGTVTLAQLQALPAGDRRFVFQEDFAAHNTRTGSTLAVASWAAGQAALQAAYDARRAAEQATHDAWAAAGSHGLEPAVSPARDIRKAVPAWLASRGVS